MNRFLVAAAVLMAALVPSIALAGTGPPPADPTQVNPSFDSDGTSGIVIVEAGGYVFGYNMDGLTEEGSGALPALPPGYTLACNDTVGWPDFDGNGVSDIVIQEAGGFQVAFLMQVSGNFVSVLSSGPIPNLPPTYTLLGWPDLDGDGDSDMVMQEPGGFTVAFLMNGLTAGPATQVPGLPGNGSYRTLGFPDLDGVNGADIVIQEAGGYTVGYLMNGTTASAPVALPSLLSSNGYTTLGFPNLDGMAGQDIVWQQSGGFTFAYLLDGTSTPTGSGQVPGLPSSGTYTTIGFPNLDAQNGHDIVIQEAGGYTVGYLMNGVMEMSNGPIPGLPSAGTYTTIGFPNLDNMDGQDVVIQEAGGYTYGYIMDGLSSTSDGPLPGLPSVGSYSTVSWDEASSIIPPPAPLP